MSIEIGSLLYVNTLSAILLGLVLTVGLIILLFGQRYLRGDRAQQRFYLAATLLVLSTTAMVAAGTLIGLTIAWVVSSVALLMLLGLYSHVPAARDGVRRTAWTFLIADAALIAATVVATSSWGTIKLSELGARAAEFAGADITVTIVACLLVLAAVGRSAQVPLQGWLPATLAAPTPVSALLHAGVVNAGGVLLVKLSPIFGASAVATHAAFALGAATAVYGTALMLTKPDVKGALAHSTMGQMGFMVMTCGLGAYAAAVFHLVAHGLYKATLFLGSGSAVARGTRERKAPHPPVGSATQRWTAVAATLITPTIAVGLAGALLYPTLSSKPGALALTTFAWVTGACLMWTWSSRTTSFGATLASALALIVVTGGYLAAVTGFGVLLESSLTGAGTATVSAWWLAPLLLVLAAGTSVLRGQHGPPQLVARLYVAVQGAGYVHRPRGAQAQAARLTARRNAPLTLQPQGGRS